jgi:hypothetical protein
MRIGRVDLSRERLERRVDRLSHPKAIDDPRQRFADWRLGPAERFLQSPTHREARADRGRDGHDGLPELQIELIP